MTLQIPRQFVYGEEVSQHPIPYLGVVGVWSNWSDVIFVFFLSHLAVQTGLTLLYDLFKHDMRNILSE